MQLVLPGARWWQKMKRQRPLEALPIAAASVPASRAPRGLVPPPEADARDDPRGEESIITTIATDMPSIPAFVTLSPTSHYYAHDVKHLQCGRQSVF